MDIQINDIEPRIQYTAAALQTTFPYPFPIFEDGDMNVLVDGVEKTLTTDYTVVGAGQTAGGNVVFVNPLNAGQIVTLFRDIAVERVSDYQDNGDFRAVTVNNDFDRIIAMIQEQESAQGRSFVIPPDSFIDTEVTPAPNSVIGFNSDGLTSVIPFTESGGVTTASQVFDDTRQQSSQVSLDEDQLNIAGNDSDLATNATNINQNAQNILDIATALASTLAGRDGVYTDTGTANAYVLTSATEAVTAYADGQRFRFRPANDNTGASTVNVSGLGVKTISNASTGFIKAGNLTELEYIAATDDFRIVNTDRYVSGDAGFEIVNGTITQWGFTGDLGDISAGSKESTYNFLVPFPTSVDEVNVLGRSLVASGSGADSVVVVWNSNTTTLAVVGINYAEQSGVLQNNWGLQWKATGR